ncbi:MAG: hypothetical protein JW808_03535 [Victivallales bacterium]|nr:hypothetical protein [Victivallales bacterium]
MPWIVTTYLTIYVLLTLICLVFMIGQKARLSLLAFEPASASFIVMLVSAFFIESLRNALDPALCAVALALDITVNFKLSLEPGLLMPLPEDAEEFHETGTALGLIFIAPAYIIAGSLCLSMLFPN